MGNKGSCQGKCFTEKCKNLSNALRNKVIIQSFTNPAQSVSAEAIWDTGATRTCITQNIFIKLNLSCVSMTMISTPTSRNKTAQEAVVNIQLPNQIDILKKLKL